LLSQPLHPLSRWRIVAPAGLLILGGRAMADPSAPSPKPLAMPPPAPPWLPAVRGPLVLLALALLLAALIIELRRWWPPRAP
jgi:hypothetical protein